MKKIMYGKSDFAEIITRNGYYIDKTRFIETIESGGSDHLFFFRPRRFGVTVKSTIRLFYSKYPKLTGGVNKFEKDLGEYTSATNLMKVFLSLLREKKVEIYLMIDEYDNLLITEAGG